MRAKTLHPAFSVLFFTVTSGFGYGFMFFLILCRVSGYIEFSKSGFLINCVIAIALITAGLLASTLHLANRKNAWRSFARFKTSWLSREGVLAVLGYPLMAAYLIAIWFDIDRLWVEVLALVIMALILALLYSTAMIYASLKTIPQWHNRYVPGGFMLLAASSSLICLGLASAWQAEELRIICLLSLGSGLLLKLLYFRSIGEPSRSNINTATSFSQAKVTLFDAGHSSENFLQREFIYEVGPKTIRLARCASLVLAFVIPAALLVIETIVDRGITGSWVAVFSLYIGLLLERWLFFVEAKHVVRHYYAKG